MSNGLPPGPNNFPFLGLSAYALFPALAYYEDMNKSLKALAAITILAFSAQAEEPSRAPADPVVQVNYSVQPCDYIRGNRYCGNCSPIWGSVYCGNACQAQFGEVVCDGEKAAPAKPAKPTN